MSYPLTIDTYTPVQGSTLEATADHANMHNTTGGSAVIALENAVGTTNGTNVLSNFTAGQQAIPIKGGTVGTTVASGTFNNSTFGTVLITGGTANDLFLETPIATGAYSNGNISGNGTIDWSKGDVQYGTLTGNGTFTYINAGTWQRLTLSLVQDATGGRTITLPASQYPNGVAPSFGTVASSWNSLVVILNSAGSYLTQAAVNFS